MRADLYETGGIGWGDDTTSGYYDDAGLTPEERAALQAEGIFDDIGHAFKKVTRKVAKIAKPIARPIGKVAGTIAHGVEEASKPIGRFKLPGGVPIVGGMQVSHLTGIALAPAKVVGGIAQGKRVDRALMGAAHDYATTFGKAMPIVTQAVPILKPFAAPLGAVGGAAAAWGEGATSPKAILAGAGQGAMQGAMSMIPGMGGGGGAMPSLASFGRGMPSLGEIMNRQPTLPDGPVREAAEQLMSSPELRSLPVAELAEHLGTSPDVASDAIATVAGATREVGELGAGALPPLRVPHPAVRRMVLGRSMYKVLPHIASVASRPVQTPSPIVIALANRRKRKRGKAHKRAVMASPVLARLHKNLQAIVFHDASGIPNGGQAKVAAPSGLNVRSGPSASTTKLGAVGIGEIVTITGPSQPGAKLDAKSPNDGGWTPINKGNLTGWVLSEWLLPVGAPAPGPAPGPAPSPAPSGGTFTARVTTKDPAPAGDLKIREQPRVGARQVGGADKNGVVTVLNWDASADFAQVRWPGGVRWPAVTGYAAKAFLTRSALPPGPRPDIPDLPPIPKKDLPGPAPGPAPGPSPDLERVARNASAELWLAEWCRQYPFLDPGFGAADIGSVWTPKAAQALSVFQKWSNDNGSRLRTDGTLDDPSYETLRTWFNANSGKGPSVPGGMPRSTGPVLPPIFPPSTPTGPSTPSTPTGPSTLPIPSLPSLPTTPTNGGSSSSSSPIPIPNVDANAGVKIEQPKKDEGGGGGGGLLILGAIAAAALAAGGGK